MVIHGIRRGPGWWTVVLMATIALGTLGPPLPPPLHAQEKLAEQDAETRIARAKELFASGDLRGARTELEQVLSLPPKFSRNALPPEF